jgi:hypothetical protein
MNKKIISSKYPKYEVGSVAVSGENLIIDDVVRVVRQGCRGFNDQR